jgi:putative Ca2+/H+ antiporter (TMEM165/GDT1 family)
VLSSTAGRLSDARHAGGGIWLASFTPPDARGALATTLVTFFLAEIGDKTQVATVLLAARYHPLWQVVAGTTLGMLLANVPVVLLGSRFADRLPLRAARIGAALLFLALGLWVLFTGA